MEHPKNNYPCIEVETETAIYDIELGPIQIEITGRCNMSCDHCRASLMAKQDMPIEQIEKIMRFARKFSPNYKEVTLSGGEPLLHQDFRKVLELVRSLGADYLTITTNGSLFSSNLLDFVAELRFERIMFSISIDATDEVEHDRFRHHSGAFDKATRALTMISAYGDPHIIPSMKTVILPDKLTSMGGFAELASCLGCQRLSFTSVIPSGRATDKYELQLSPTQKKFFLEEIYRLKREFPHINITTIDPLKCLVRGFSDVSDDPSEIIFDGCPAGTVSFNVNSDGTMTPCALLDVPIMNTFDLSLGEIEQEYRNSHIVQNMLDMNLDGKCGRCDKKYQCGGCRARALAQNGNMLDEDPECWL